MPKTAKDRTRTKDINTQFIYSIKYFSTKKKNPMTEAGFKPATLLPLLSFLVKEKPGKVKGLTHWLNEEKGATLTRRMSADCC